MIKSITVTNYLGESIKMELTRPEETGFIITKIEGLGPGNATINTADISTTDGATYNSARLPARNIVISIQFLSDSSIEDIRQKTYQYFPIKKKLTLQIETDNRTSEIEGYVESNEPDIFSQEESTDISIICPYPFFYSYSKNTTSFAAIEAGFEFPFSNESLTEPLLEFSMIRTTNDRTIVYEGDQEIGVTFRIHADGPAEDITLFNVKQNETMKINTDRLEALTGQGLIAGDEIVICTEVGKKSATLIRNGESTNVLNIIDRTSSWFRLTKGSNIFAYQAASGADNIEIEIENRVIYEGV